MAEKQYIDREALLKHQRKMRGCGLSPEDDYWDYAVLAEDIESIPAADVAPVVHAEWDENKYPFCNVCTDCGLIIDRTCIKRKSGKLNLCPNCGAKMDGGKHG